jgi:pimeloyl-ACP methyl ester carboxylesterase
MTLPANLPEFANTAFGTHYRIAGAGRPVLLIHDRGRDLSMWDPLLPHLAPSLRVIRYDLLGHGRSAKPPGEVGWREWQSQLELLMSYLKIADAAVVGLGLGAELARALTDDRAAVDRHLSAQLETFLTEIAQLAIRAA